MDSYDVEVAKQDNPQVWTRQSMSTSTMVTGLLSNSTYTIRAWARVGEEGGQGIWEDLGQVSCTTGFFMSSVYCTPLATDAILVNWPPVVPAGGSSPVSYSMRHKVRGDGQWGPWRTVGAQSSTVLSGLQPNTPYDIEVRASEGDLQSEPSSASCFTSWAP
ncbi:fibronectin type III domain-containing protein [Nannocystis sp. ILAH1]|uniref:fibronectin type III domain-containing protein n=1 Tax=Nannocystis sp. ILAH1 TaxID=2996789 RepID=UPI00226FDE5E|nr:fibronectin type III domain-containing protein [Nannocystis sp. ILAH1]